MATVTARSMTSRQQRLIAAGLLVFALALLSAIVLVPLTLLHRHYNNAIDTFQDRLDTYRRVAAQQTELKKALEELKAKDSKRFYLKNTAINLAGAELQDLVRAAIENNGGRISTIQVANAKEEGRFRQIGVSVQLFANTANLQEILFALETQQPYVTVENMTIRPLNAFRGFKPAPGTEPEVNVQLDVAGYAIAEPGKK